MPAPKLRKRLKQAGIVIAVLLVLVLASIPLLAARARSKRPLVAPQLLALAATPPDRTADALHVTWTGVAGVRVEAAGPSLDEVLLIDPYVTRHSIPELLTPLDVDVATVHAAFPRANAILVGHSHHDHLLDAIEVAKHTGAVLHGSASSCAIAAGLGLANEKCRAFTDGEVLKLGAFEVTVVAHPHGRSALGVPFPGEVTSIGDGAPWVWDLKMGGAHAFVIRALSRTLYHQGSAGLDDTMLKKVAGIGPELALVCTALRQNTPRYEHRLFTSLLPMRVAAIHHDDFFGAPIGASVPLLAGVELKAFEGQVDARVGPQALVRLVPFERFRVNAGPPGR